MNETKEKTYTLDEILEEAGIETKSEHKLVLWNDDVNTFEWVIICLIQIMGFTFKKAEGTAYEVHFKGKSILKTGSKSSLEPYKKLLEERGLSLTIEN